MAETDEMIKSDTTYEVFATVPNKLQEFNK